MPDAAMESIFSLSTTWQNVDSMRRTTVDKKFIDTLCDFKNEHNCHVLLVTHARKTNEAAPTGKMDVKGTGALTDMPDNVMAVWRNIPRELAQRKAERMGYESLDKDEQTAIQMPASMIRLLKQREGKAGSET
jgi:twinkle protein